jgi:hypothetical protein
MYGRKGLLWWRSGPFVRLGCDPTMLGDSCNDLVKDHTVHLHLKYLLPASVILSLVEHVFTYFCGDRVEDLRFYSKEVVEMVDRWEVGGQGWGLDREVEFVQKTFVCVCSFVAARLIPMQ